MTDPRRRTGRHFLTPENLSSTLQITNLPPEWNQDIITSVVAGSGPVIDIKAKNDPRTGKLTGVLFDYLTSKDCKRAWEILNRIENFPVKIEQIIPPNYKDHLRETANKNSQKQVLQLNRDSYPFEAGLELPFEMVTEVPIPRRPPPPQAANNTNSVSNNTNIQFPDILSKASKHLPSFQDGSIIAPDKISQNLSKIPPLQLIEIISNLKILSNQENIQKSQLESFLDTNSDITISVTQALLEMGFIDYSVVTKVLKSQVGEGPSLLSSNNTSNSNTPVSVIRNNTPLHVPSNEVSNNRAWEILNRIENFPVKIEQIIPPNYKDHLRETANKNSQKQVLQLNRDSYPFEAGLELPFEMVTEVPIPRRPPPPQAANNTNSVSNNTNIQFPDILSKASKHLPSFQDGSIIAPDKISQNLSKIPPLQLIEIISNLKILSNQENIQKSQLESFLDTNSDITISVTQALLEMGFIDYSVVTKVLKSQVGEGPSLLSSNNTSNSNTPVSVIRNNTPLHVPSNEVSNNPNNMPLNVAMPMPMSTPPFIPLPLQQQPFGFAPPGPFMPPAQGPSMGQPVLANQLGQVQQQNISSTEGPSNANKANDSGTINMAKLQLLPENQQDMIKQVLTLTPAQIQSLPSDQQLMVENFRKEYII